MRSMLATPVTAYSGAPKSVNSSIKSTPFPPPATRLTVPYLNRGFRVASFVIILLPPCNCQVKLPQRLLNFRKHNLPQPFQPLDLLVGWKRGGDNRTFRAAGWRHQMLPPRSISVRPMRYPAIPHRLKDGGSRDTVRGQGSTPPSLIFPTRPGPCSHPGWMTAGGCLPHCVV